MPSNIDITTRYRRATCCATCAFEHGGSCGLKCRAVSPAFICDSHEDSAEKAPRQTACAECAYGPAGDATCGRGVSGDAESCFLGRTIGRGR